MRISRNRSLLVSSKTLQGNIILGKREGYPVTCTIRITEPTSSPSAVQMVQFTDHTVGPKPTEISIQWDVQDRWGSTSGQAPSADRVIDKPAIPQADIDFIDEVWRLHHLNTMHPNCDHQDRSGGAPCVETGYKYETKWLAKKVPQQVIERLADILINHSKNLTKKVS